MRGENVGNGCRMRPANSKKKMAVRFHPWLAAHTPARVAPPAMRFFFILNGRVFQPLSELFDSMAAISSHYKCFLI